MDDNTNLVGTTDVKPGKKKTIWLVIVILALITSNTAWGLFYYQQQTKLQAEITKLETEKTRLNKELADAKSSADSEDSSDYREIPELGVKYKLDSTTDKLTYNYNGEKDNEVITWTTLDLANKSTGEDSCYSFSSPVTTWSIVKLESGSDEGSKQVGKVKVYRSQPDGGDDSRPEACKDKALLATARAAEKKAFDSLKPIQ